MKLVATRNGFYHGERIRRGQSFDFDETEQVQARKDGKPVFADGKPVMVSVKQPAWAMAPAAAKAEIAQQDAKERAGDTKPVAAQANAKKRATPDA